MDAVIFSIRRDHSRYSKVSAACQRLSMLGIPILGTVVIGLNDGAYGTGYPSRYGGYGSYGYHNSYYNSPPPASDMETEVAAEEIEDV